MLLTENTDEVAAVPSGMFAVTKADGIYRSACSGGAAAEASGGQPELILLRPVGLLQGKGTHDQHLSGQILPGHGVAVGAVEHLEFGLYLAELVDESVQHGRVAFHREVMVAVASGDEGSSGPFLVLRAESAIILFLL